MAVFHDRLPLQARAEFVLGSGQAKGGCWDQLRDHVLQPCATHLSSSVLQVESHESASKTKLTTKKLFEILSANLTVTSGEAVTQSFLEVLMALWNSLLSDTSFREEVLLSEELSLHNQSENKSSKTKDTADKMRLGTPMSVINVFDGIRSRSSAGLSANFALKRCR